MLSDDAAEPHEFGIAVDFRQAALEATDASDAVLGFGWYSEIKTIDTHVWEQMTPTDSEGQRRSNEMDPRCGKQNRYWDVTQVDEAAEARSWFTRGIEDELDGLFNSFHDIWRNDQPLAYRLRFMISAYCVTLDQSIPIDMQWPASKENAWGGSVSARAGAIHRAKTPILSRLRRRQIPAARRRQARGTLPITPGRGSRRPHNVACSPTVLEDYIYAQFSLNPPMAFLWVAG